MNVYAPHSQLSYEQTERNVSALESYLLQSIADYFQIAHWKELFQDFFLLKRLLNEREEWHKGNEYPLITAMLREKSRIYNVEQAISQKVDKLKNRLLNIIKKQEVYEPLFFERIEALLKEPDTDKLASQRSSFNNRSLRITESTSGG